MLLAHLFSLTFYLAVFLDVWKLDIWYFSLHRYGYNRYDEGMLLYSLLLYVLEKYLVVAQLWFIAHLNEFRPAFVIFCKVGGIRKLIEVLILSDGAGNSLLDMDKPFCYLGFHCVLFHILLILWGNYLVSDFLFPL